MESKPLVPKLRFPEFRDAPGWDRTTIGKIAYQVVAGGTPDTAKPEYWNGTIRWMNSGELNLKRVFEVQGRISEVGLRNSSTRPIPRRSVLIGLAGQGKTRGTVAMNMVDLCTNQSIAAVLPNDGQFSEEFLYHELDRRYDELRRLSAGGEGRGGLNLQIIKSLGLYLPQLQEQQKIAECLTSLDELIAAEGRKLEALRAHKKGLMQHLFPREGETTPRLRFPEFRNAREWRAKCLGEIATVLMCKRIFAHETNPNSGVPFFKIGTLGGKPDAFISEALYRQYRRAYNFPRRGEILITCSGTIGKCLVYDGEDAYYQDSNIIWLSNPEQEVRNDFLYLIVSTVDWGKLNSTTITRIYGPDLRALAIRFPFDTAEQHRIASCLASLDAQITVQANKLDTLKLHKQGLMQGLFPSLGAQ